MNTRNNLGAHTIAILTHLEARGQSTARQVSDATGIEYDTARQYLRRCAFRGLVAIDHTSKAPAYTVKPTWRERLVPKQRQAVPVPAPENAVARAIRKRPALQTIWN